MAYSNRPLAWPQTALKLASAPSAHMCTLQEIKDFLRVDSSSSSDNAVLSALNIAAEAYIEGTTGHAFINQTWEYQVDGTVPSVIELPMAPLNTVSTIKTFDTANASATFSSANYTLDTVSMPGRVYLDIEATYPFRRDAAGYKARYVAGYGAAASNVPGGVRELAQTAIKQTVRNWYECGGDAVMPGTLLALLGLLKVHRL